MLLNNSSDLKATLIGFYPIDGRPMKTIASYTLTCLLVAFLSACGGGGGSSSGAINGVSGSTPHISSISPNAILADGPLVTLTVNGSNFTSGSQVGIASGGGISIESTQMVSDQELQAQINYFDIEGETGVAIIVLNSGDIQSNTVPLGVTNPVPSLRNYGPSGASVGAPAVALDVGGSNFVPATTVAWNGAPLTTTYISTTEVTATIPAADLTSMQTAEITVVNPGPGGGSSAAQYFTVFRMLNQPVNDIVWDSAHQVLYASVPNGAASDANDILTINPETGAIIATQPAGSDPDVLAISDDDQYLYVGEDGSSAIQRFILPGLTPDITWNLGSGTYSPYFALDIQVAPGSPHTTAVTLGESGVSSVADGGIVIYDDSTPRPVTVPGFGPTINSYDSLQWGANDTALYASDTENVDGGDFYVLSVNSHGAALTSDVKGVVSSPIHYDAGNGLFYADGGVILDSMGTQVGAFQSSLLPQGGIVPDSSINRAFQVYGAGGGAMEITIQSFDMTTLQPVGNLDGLPVVAFSAPRIIRWGPNGLALIVNDALSNTGILLLEGSFVH